MAAHFYFRRNQRFSVILPAPNFYCLQHRIHFNSPYWTDYILESSQSEDRRLIKPPTDSTTLSQIFEVSIASSREQIIQHRETQAYMTPLIRDPKQLDPLHKVNKPPTDMAFNNFRVVTSCYQPTLLVSQREVSLRRERTSHPAN